MGRHCLFLSNCTSTSIEQPDSITLSAYPAYKKDKHPEIADKILSQTKAIFGEGRTHQMLLDYPAETSWKIDKNDLQKAISYLINGQPWPTFSLGPVELYIVYDFKLIDIATKRELPYQENISSMLIWLSKRCSNSSNFWFPFTAPDESFFNYLNQIEKYLPFKLEKKYLKLGRPNKQGTQHIFKKLFPKEK